MKDIKTYIVEAINESAGQITITLNNKTVKYPVKRSHRGLCLPYDKLVEEFGEPIQNPTNKMDYAWQLQIKRPGKSPKTFILYKWNEGEYTGTYSGSGDTILEIYIPAIEWIEYERIIDDILKYFNSDGTTTPFSQLK